MCLLLSSDRAFLCAGGWAPSTFPQEREPKRLQLHSARSRQLTQATPSLRSLNASTKSDHAYPGEAPSGVSLRLPAGMLT